MATYKELNNLYKEKYHSELTRSTLTKWIKEGRLKAEQQTNGRYNYNIESFKQIINSNDYNFALLFRKDDKHYPEQEAMMSRGYKRTLVEKASSFS